MYVRYATNHTSFDIHMLLWVMEQYVLQQNVWLCPAFSRPTPAHRFLPHLPLCETSVRTATPWLIVADCWVFVSGGYTKSCSKCQVKSSLYTCRCSNSKRGNSVGLVDLSETDPTPDPSGFGNWLTYLSADSGMITNYYGYLSCFQTINSELEFHNWPCKGNGWAPWGSGTVKVGMEVAPFVPKTGMFAIPFKTANTTTTANATAVAVTFTA